MRLLLAVMLTIAPLAAQAAQAARLKTYVETGKPD